MGFSLSKTLGLKKIRLNKPLSYLLPAAGILSGGAALGLLKGGTLGALGQGLNAGLATGAKALYKSPLSSLKKAVDLYGTGTALAEGLGIIKSPEQKLLDAQKASLEKRDALVNAELAKLSPNADQVESGAQFVDDLESGLNQAGSTLANRGLTNSSYGRSLYDSYGTRARLAYGANSINNKNAAINQRLSILNMLSNPNDYQSMINNARTMSTDNDNALLSMGEASAYGLDPFDEFMSSFDALFGKPKPKTNARISSLSRVNPYLVNGGNYSLTRG